MTRILLTGNGAAAWGARLAGVDYVPAFPITPQTEIIETLAGWYANGTMRGRLVTLESEHSMVTAAAAAAATGVRVFSATSSQGLLYAMEMLYAASGWRAPFVLANVSRGLATPVTLESDHNDILAARDAGCLILVCGTGQEVVDLTLIAYRLAEDSGVRLPAIVNLDGFYLSFTREPVALPDSAGVQRFLPPFAAHGGGFRASRPVSQAMAVLGGGPYSYFRYETHLAALNALSVYDQAAADFERAFGRGYPAVHAYRADDADIVFFMMGAFGTKAQAAVDQLRDAGQRIGLLRLRLLRPLPQALLRRLLAGRKGVAVIDQNLAPGHGGVLHTELAAVLCGMRDAPLVTSFIGGLGGRDIPAEEFHAMAEVTAAAVRRGEAPPPRLLYTAGELSEVRKLQAVAAAERARERGSA